MHFKQNFVFDSDKCGFSGITRMEADHIANSSLEDILIATLLHVVKDFR